MMDHLFVREVMNGTWLILSVFMAGIFMWRVGQHITKHFAAAPEDYRNPFRTIARLYGTVRCQRDVQAAVALSIFFLGSVVRAAWIWAVLWCSNPGHSCSWVSQHYHAGVVATACAVVGCLCLLRVFTPPHWQPWPWLGGGVLAVGVPLLLHFL